MKKKNEYYGFLEAELLGGGKMKEGILIWAIIIIMIVVTFVFGSYK